MTSEVDVGGMTVEVEPSHQYSVTFRYRVTDGSRGAAWHNSVGHGSACEAKVCHWILPCRKNGTHWHSLMLAECFWGPNRSMSTVKQWVVHFSSGDSVIVLSKSIIVSMEINRRRYFQSDLPKICCLEVMIFLNNSRGRRLKEAQTSYLRMIIFSISSGDLWCLMSGQGHLTPWPGVALGIGHLTGDRHLSACR